MVGVLSADAPIQTARDYFDPRNLRDVRNCNMLYKDAKKLYKRGEWGEAIKQYQKFFKINIADFDGLIEASVCYHQLYREKKKKNLLDLSLELLLQAKTLKGGSTKLYSRLVETYFAKGEKKEVTKYLESLQIRGEHEEVKRLKKIMKVEKTG